MLISTRYLYFTRRDGICNEGDNILLLSKPNMLYLILIESTSIISSRVSIQFSHYYGIYYGKEEKFIIIFPFYVDYA